MVSQVLDRLEVMAQLQTTKTWEEKHEGRTSEVSHAVRSAVTALLSLQNEGGYFCGRFEGDSILTSEYILLQFILRRENQHHNTLKRIANHLRFLQRADGSWGQYPGSPPDMSACTKAYFALKLMGDDPQSEHMQKARRVILSCGGAEKCNTFSSFYLACLGQISWDAVPYIPPQAVLLPRWFPFHLSKVAAWTRTMIVPLAIVTTLRPIRQLPASKGINELFIDEKHKEKLCRERDRKFFTWHNTFLRLDSLLKKLRRHHLLPMEKTALKKAEKWIIERSRGDMTEGLGAIFPPMVYIQIALRALGRGDDDPLMIKARNDLDDLMIEFPGEERIDIQPCFSPVWDTGIALYALTEAGLGYEEKQVRQACDWLRAHECRYVGDWEVNTRYHVEPSGWYFEFNNQWYPDVDDTAMVAMSLQRAGGKENIEAAQRGVRWLLALQNDDGGWAAFDRTRNRPWMEKVPFADHNAMQDPSCADITGRVLECLHHLGYADDHIAVVRGVNFILSHQEKEGCWWGRWGVNYIYGTWQALGGLVHSGISCDHPAIQHARDWLLSVQKPDGSFGESCASYEDRSLMGQGKSTASQTAWGAMALMFTTNPEEGLDEAAGKAIDWLRKTQLTEVAENADDVDPPGSWVEKEFTGTGFPRVFYIRYHMYRLYFPLMALARWKNLYEGKCIPAER